MQPPLPPPSPQPVVVTFDTLRHDLANDWQGFFEADDAYDAVIHAGEEPNTREFSAHSVVLRARCSYFRAALSNDWARKDGEKFVFRKPNITPAIFELILKYLYAAEIPLESQDGAAILDIIVAADELDLHRLINHVQTYLISEKTEWLQRDPVGILSTVFRHAACKSLRDCCLEAICKKPDLVFESDDFVSLDESILILLLKRDDLMLREVEVWEHLLRWGCHQATMVASGADEPASADVAPSSSGGLFGRKRTNGDDASSTTSRPRQLDPEDVAHWTNDDFALLESTLYQYLPLVRWFQMSGVEFSRKVRPWKRILPQGLFEDLLTHHLEPGCSVRSAVLPPRMPLLFDSAIIDDPAFGSVIARWIEGGGDDAASSLRSDSGRVPYDFRLLLRASRDDFLADTFHKLADGKGPTIVVAKVAGSDQIIGGYNPLDWGDGPGYLATPDAFIFSLGQGGSLDLARVARVNDAEKAIYASPTSGPTFGAGPDFSVANKAWSAKAKSYPSIFQFYTTFVQDYEVFQVRRKHYPSIELDTMSVISLEQDGQRDDTNDAANAGDNAVQAVNGK